MQTSHPVSKRVPRKCGRLGVERMQRATLKHHQDAFTA